MAHTIARLPENGAEQGASTPSPDEIRFELRRIIESPVFHGSKRCQQFLQYVCDKALSGEAGALKERTVAVEVFGRHPQSDFAEDTIVRVGAREVRKRLAQYYVSPVGLESKVRIGLPSGSYAPEFRYAEMREEKAAELPVALATPTTSPVFVEPPSKTLRPRYILAIAAVALVAVAAAVLLPTRTSQSAASAAFSQFWQPVLSSSEPLLLVVGNPVVYHPSARATQLSEQRLPPMTVPVQRPIRVEPKELDGSDIVPVMNQYVGFGDMVVSTEIAAMLARQSKKVRVRLASSVPFADLRQAQTLLIGAVTNRWTMELGQASRYRFHWSPGHRIAIVDTGVDGKVPDGSRKEWHIEPRDDGSVSEDYILVSRTVNSSAGGLQIVAAGLKQFGTEAAGRLLADPEHLGPILRMLPGDWPKKNVQLVLRVKVIGNTPDQPVLVASHVW